MEDKKKIVEEIKSSIRERIEKFTRIQQDYERSRKTMDQHIKDYKDKYDTLDRNHRNK